MASERTREILATVGERLMSERVRLGMSVEAAATSAQIAEARLVSAEEGDAALDENELARLAEVYGVDVTAFFGGRVTPFQYLAGA